MKRFFLFFIFPVFANAQFAPAAGQPGTSAVKKDSSAIVNWAISCKITRGLQDISNGGGAYASVGDSSKAIGPADGTNVVSLGDGGFAILNFQSPIKNAAGNDFCIFENSFDPGFLELAFVEVSSDGINYTRFPATCNMQNTVQIGPFDTSGDPTKLNNLAGKYIANFGTPFDLQELAGSPNLNINNITHVKIIDVVGCIQSQYATFDANNNKINDLWPTAFASCGFDLDAVGVIHQVPVSVTELEKLEPFVSVFPSRVQDEIKITNRSGSFLTAELFDVNGKSLLTNSSDEKINSISVNDLSEGIYFLKIKNDKTYFTKKIIKVD